MLAPGRMRAFPRIENAARMSLWQRAPREVYRVYGEDQYLEGEERATEGETVPREDAATVEPDSRAGTSGATFAAEVSPAAARTDGSSSTRSGGQHASRLIGVGVLAGVSLATLALVFLNASHPRGVATEPFAQGARMAGRQRIARASGAANAQAITHSESSSPAQPSRLYTSNAIAPAHTPGSRLQDRMLAGSKSDPAPRFGRTWSAALGSSCSTAPAPDPVELPTPVAVESSAPVAVVSPVQDEFSFEQ